MEFVLTFSPENCQFPTDITMLASSVHWVYWHPWKALFGHKYLTKYFELMYGTSHVPIRLGHKEDAELYLYANYWRLLNFLTRRRWKTRNQTSSLLGQTERTPALQVILLGLVHQSCSHRAEQLITDTYWLPTVNFYNYLHNNLRKAFADQFLK